MDLRRATISGSGMFISPPASMGPSAWSSSVLLRPSHIWMELKAVFTMVGVARPSFCMSKPVAVGSPSDQPSAGLWQLAQLMFALRDRRGSKNNICPSSTRAEFGRFSAGAGALVGAQPRIALCGLGGDDGGGKTEGKEEEQRQRNTLTAGDSGHACTTPGGADAPHRPARDSA